MVGDDEVPARPHGRGVPGPAPRSSASKLEAPPGPARRRARRSSASVPKTSRDVCPNIGWVKDFYDAADASRPRRSAASRSSRRTTTTTRSSTTRSSTRRSTTPPPITDPRERAEAYGEIDRDIIAQAPVDPVRVGQAGEHPVVGREGRDQRVQLGLGPELHLARVGDGGHGVAAYVARRLAWMVVLLLARQRDHVLRLLRPAVGRPGRAARRAQRRPRAHRGDPPAARARRGPGTQQFRHYLEDLVLHFDLGYSYQSTTPGQGADPRPPAGHDLARRRRDGDLARGGLAGRARLSAVRRGSLLDRVAMGVALIAVSAPVYWLGLVALYLFAEDLGRLPLFPGSGSYVRPITEDPWQWFQSLLLPWLVLAASFAAIYARLLRGEPDRGDGRGLHPHRARQGPARAARGACATALRGAITPLVTRRSASTSACCSAARSSPRPSSTSPGLGAARLRRDPGRATCPRSRARCCSPRSSSSSLNLVVDVVYAFLDPRVRY